MGERENVIEKLSRAQLRILDMFVANRERKQRRINSTERKKDKNWNKVVFQMRHWLRQMDKGDICFPDELNIEADGQRGRMRRQSGGAPGFPFI